VISLARFTLFAATAATALVSVGTALGRLESRAWVGGAVTAYVTLVAIGLRRPTLRMFTDAVARCEEGAALIVDVRAGAEPSLPELLEIAEKHRVTLTLALTMRDAVAHPDAVRSALARAHSVALVERPHADDHDEASASATAPSRPARAPRWSAIERRITRLEREIALWDERFADLDPPELWLADGLYTPMLQRLADAFDRTLLAPTADLRDERDPAALREALVDALAQHAIVRVIDGPALRAQLPAVLDAVARLGVPVRALTLPDAA
jgi:hypothetical protein